MPDTIQAATLIERLNALLGPRGLLTDLADTAAYVEDWRRLYHGRTPAVARPASTEETASVLRLCAEAGTAVVPQGGNTSMVGGATPSEDGREIVLSLARLNRVRALDRLKRRPGEFDTHHQLLRLGLGHGVIGPHGRAVGLESSREDERRRFPHVVGVGLERQAQQRHLPPHQRTEVLLQFPDHPPLLQLVDLDHRGQQLEVVTRVAG